MKDDTKGTPMTRYISCADTAKLLRLALKAAFPGTKFSVRSKTYSGGGSISVGWTDGPKVADVDATTWHYKGSSFDGMIDLKSYHSTILVSGDTMEEVHFMADHIFCRREHSAELLAELEKKARPLGSSRETNCYGGAPGCRHGYGGELGDGSIITVEGDRSCANAGCSPACAAQAVAGKVTA